MAEKKYIEIEAAIETIKSLYPSVPLVKLNIDKWHEKNKAYMECEMAIESIPAADVQPAVRGSWTRIDYQPCGHDYKCSERHDLNDRASRYCPNCGADMREES